jgi:hypothetical protein
MASKKKIKKSAKKTLMKKPKKIIKKPVKKAIKKSTKKKIIKKRPAAKKKTATKKLPKTEGNFIGDITHYFPHVQAAVVKLKKPLSKGDSIKIKGHTTDLSQIVSSMQIDRVDIQTAKKGDEIGLLVSSRVRQADKVYKL